GADGSDRRRHAGRRVSHWHSPAGSLDLQTLAWMLLPVPVPSQSTSGGPLFTITLPRTTLSTGAVPPKPLTTATPALNSVGPEAVLPVITLPLIVTSWPPMMANPIPDAGGPSSLGGHALVLLRMRLPDAWTFPAGPGASANTRTPTQLSWSRLPVTFTPWASRMKVPNSESNELL